MAVFRYVFADLVDEGGRKRGENFVTCVSFYMIETSDGPVLNLLIYQFRFAWTFVCF